jgi:hypothetical protein
LASRWKFAWAGLGIGRGMTASGQRTRQAIGDDGHRLLEKWAQIDGSRDVA